MKIKQVSLWLGLICILSLLFACDSGDDPSENKVENSDHNRKFSEKKTEKITGSKQVQAKIEEAKKILVKKATITVICSCGELSIKGQGETESIAKEKAQKKCQKRQRSESLSSCETIPSA